MQKASTVAGQAILAQWALAVDQYSTPIHFNGFGLRVLEIRVIYGEWTAQKKKRATLKPPNGPNVQIDVFKSGIHPPGIKRSDANFTIYTFFSY